MERYSTIPTFRFSISFVGKSFVMCFFALALMGQEACNDEECQQICEDRYGVFATCVCDAFGITPRSRSTNSLRSGDRVGGLGGASVPSNSVSSSGSDRFTSRLTSAKPICGVPLPSSPISMKMTTTGRSAQLSLAGNTVASSRLRSGGVLPINRSLKLKELGCEFRLKGSARVRATRGNNLRVRVMKKCNGATVCSEGVQGRVD
jgi:hypothetical protein